MTVTHRMVRTPGVLSLFAALASCVLLGCATGIGPRAVRAQRGDYNAALQETNDQQLLLNIVRLRYGETPSFLEVTGIVTQLRLEVGGSAEATAGTDMGATVGGTVVYADQPTITYLPSQGEQFVRRFLTPIAPETLVLLWESGWSFKRVARVAFQRLNRISNAPRASGPTPSRLETPPDFTALLDKMAPLVRAGTLRFEFEEIVVGEAPPSRRVVLRIANGVDPVVQDILRMLELAPDRDHYPVVTGVLHEAGGPPWESIHVQTRSLLGVLFFISNGVELPAEHSRSGIVTTTIGGSGETVDWAAITGDVLRIRVSSSRPDNARIVVPHRGHWFYIGDTDIRSKSTFVLLTQLYALQASPPSTGGPTLTLPVGR